MSSGFRLDEIVRSDALADLREFRKHNPLFQQLIEEPLQVRLVLDANIVQRELRWRLRFRRETQARSALHEAIDSGTILAFAPTALDSEIHKHVADLADYAGVSEDRVRAEWMELKAIIHLYEPEIMAPPRQYVDPDDAPYRQACMELGAHAVYSRDAHFKTMDVPLIMIDLDQIFRKYARANSVKLAVSIGSTVTLTISIGALKELFALLAKGIDKIPTPVKVAFVGALAVALIHSRSRAKLVEVCKKLWNGLNNPKFRSTLAALAVQLAEVHQTSHAMSKEIQAVIPTAPKRSAIVFAREICLVEKAPLSLAVLESKIISSGYVTRSARFRSYLGQLLRHSNGFVEVSPGLWTLQTIAQAA
jgi:hypothetical protein